MRVTPARFKPAASAGRPFSSCSKVAASARMPLGRPAAPHMSFFAARSSWRRFRSSADMAAISGPRASTDSKPWRAAKALTSAWVFASTPMKPQIRLSVNGRAGGGPAAAGVDHPAGPGGRAPRGERHQRGHARLGEEIAAGHDPVAYLSARGPPARRGAERQAGRR